MRRLPIALGLCLLLALSPAVSPAVAARATATPAPDLSVAFEPSQVRRLVTLPTGAQVQYYAQNDPVWSLARYEVRNGDHRRRTFGLSGCNPTALAMVIATLVPQAELTRLLDGLNEPAPVVCRGTVGDIYCEFDDEDVRIALDTPQLLHDYLPLALGRYALGFNAQGERYRLTPGGTTYRMFEPVAALYGLRVESAQGVDAAFDALDAGGLAILLCAGSTQPFSGGDGHYVVAAGYDADFLYLLDPQLVEEYPRDNRGALQQAPGEPGLLRVPRELVWRLSVTYSFCFFSQDSHTSGQ